MALNEITYAFNTCTTHDAIIFIKIVTREVRGKGIVVWYVPNDMQDDCLLEPIAEIMPVTWRLNIGCFDET